MESGTISIPYRQEPGLNIDESVLYRRVSGGFVRQTMSGALDRGLDS